MSIIRIITNGIRKHRPGASLLLHTQGIAGGRRETRRMRLKMIIADFESKALFLFFLVFTGLGLGLRAWGLGLRLGSVYVS